jgi:hypothetical protein
MKTAVTCLVLSLSAMVGLVGAQPKEMPPGLWETTTKMDIPGMPAEIVAKMGNMTMTRCVKSGEGKWTDQRGPMDKGERKCEVAESKTDGNKVSWKLKCANGTSGEGSLTHNGKDAFKMEMNMASERGNMKVVTEGRKIADVCEKNN